MGLKSKDERDQENGRRLLLQRLMDEIESETTDEQRAATRRAQDEMYDDSGLPA